MLAISWFILDESGLHIRCRYPDSVDARHNVGRWLDALVRRIRDHASNVREIRAEYGDGRL